MDELNIDIFEAINQGNLYEIKQFDERLFQIENKLKVTLDKGVGTDEFKEIKSLYQAVVSSRDLLKELY